MKRKESLAGYTVSELAGFLAAKNIDTRYAEIVATDFYRRGIRNFDKMTRVPSQVRKVLHDNFSVDTNPPSDSWISSDGSAKYLFFNSSGAGHEAVLLPETRRRTVCVSTQAGCRMGCPFCMTGRSGFKGNLTAGEIINQVISLPGHKEIDHVVFMGMGEPLDNLDEVLKACWILTAAWGLAISPRNITVSTVGIFDGVRRFLKESDCNLTISLFSPFPGERVKVVPAEKANPVKEILREMKSFPLKKKRRLSAAYILISNVNDSREHLEELIRVLKDSQLRVNLLPYHPVGNDEFKPSDKETLEFFREGLTSAGISASVRKSRGSDVSAACGLLAAGLKSS